MSLNIATKLINTYANDLNIKNSDIADRFLKGMTQNFNFMDILDLLIRQSAGCIIEEPDYGVFAARILNEKIKYEVLNNNIHCFSDAIKIGHEQGILTDRIFNFVLNNKDILDKSIDDRFNDNFTYFALSTVYDRYLLRHPSKRVVFENPQYFFMRVACGLYEDLDKVIELYRLMAGFLYLPGSPTLFNSGTKNPQLSSCFLLDSPPDSLDGIYKSYHDVAKLSKHGGGIGISYSKVRSRGSLIKGTNGLASGIVPWLKTLDASVSAVNQGGRRKGAACVYLETWHADIEAFLELRDSTGEASQRTHNLNLANWVPDLFMKRVLENAAWSLFDPSKVPGLTDSYGEEFEQIYLKAEKEKIYEKQVMAQNLYGRMMKTLAQTGNGWMAFKDTSNIKCNQTLKKGRTVHLSNLCTEIIEVSSKSETAVCNLGSINLMRHFDNNKFDYLKLKSTVKTAIRQLDEVIDVTFYPIEEALNSNQKWRPVGLGLMGLQDLFFKLKIPFDSADAKSYCQKIMEEIYFTALETSIELAKEKGAHKTFDETKASLGNLQCDFWHHQPIDKERYESIKKNIKIFGLRNSLLIAIAPTATIASIAGCYECIEPQVSNIFKRETLSGEFLQINQYLVADLKSQGLWTRDIIDKIIDDNGSIQNIEKISESLKIIYRTAWEIPQKELIDMALIRGPYIDQSQSLNLFMASPSIGKLSSMYFYAWKNGLKTCYYLRSRPAKEIAKTKKLYSDEAAISCSLENPSSCEACG